MFRSIFRPDSPLMITMNQITDCIFLSLFWLVGCFPVITAGVSAAALYDAVWQGYRKGDRNPWSRFAQAFRRNLKPGILAALVFLPLAALVLWALIQVWNSAVYGRISWAVFAAAAFVAVVLTGMGSIVFPQLSRFENPTAALFANSFRLGMAHLPGTVALGLLNMATIFLCARFVVPLFFLPALSTLVGTLFIEPMFRPYMPQETE